MIPHRVLVAHRHRLVVCMWTVVGLVLSASSIGAQALSVSGSPPTLRVTGAVAGNPPTAVSNSSTTYTARARRTNQPQQITGRLNSNMPAGTTLTVNLAAITGATSAGTVTLTTTSRMLVNDIRNTNNRTASVTYTFSATAAAGVIPTAQRTVTLTILAAP